MVRGDALAPSSHRPLGRYGLVTLLGVALVGPLDAQTRYARRFGVDHGLVPDYVVSLAQDQHDLLWIGTNGGLYRYDGVEMRRWAPETLRSWVSVIAVSPTGGLAVLEEDQGGVFRVTRDGASPVTGPTGSPLRGVGHLAVDSAGTLWAIRGDDVLSLRPGGPWDTVPRASLDGSMLRKVFAAPTGGAFVLTGTGVWHLTAGTAPRHIASVAEPRHVVAMPDGRLLIVSSLGPVLEVKDGRTTVLLDLKMRGIAVAERNGTYWVAYDRQLVALSPGAQPDVLGPDDGVASGGPLLVDHEGSLWLGTGAGLLQFPEPDARFWTERHGLPIAHTRFLAQTGDTIWVSTWRGTAAIARVAGRWRAWAIDEWASVRRLFVGADGSLRGPEFPELLAFATRADGSEWLGTRGGLLVVRAPGARPEVVRGLPFSSDSVPIDGVLHDRTGRTWLASPPWICHARDVDPGNTPRAAWTCDETHSGHHVSSLLEPPHGSLWASFVRGDVWRYRAGAWAMLDAGDELPLVDVHALVPSPSEGVWVVGSQGVVRLVEDPDAPGGVRAVERLTGWHGLRMAGAADLLEEPDGTLWLATGVGVARLPPAARRPAGPPGRVVLVDAWVDEKRVSLLDDVVLPHQQNRLALRFAAPSYRDPTLLRYQVRLSPDDPWTSVTGPPVFRWVNLRPGRYQAEVRASLDGRAWTAEHARFAFRVRPPWYLSSWALALFAVVAVVAVTVIHRARVAVLLGLERQRTRIAMDLHDQMGSGLGSIGILSGVLASEARDTERRRKLANEIADISQELGTVLSDIVWSLDPRSSTLEEVAGRLVEHGGRLFSGDSVRFTARFPDPWPVAPLDFPVRRGVLLIGLEALHNAARHARARHVALGVQPGGGGWQLVVEDDGCGLSEAARRGERVGVGLQSLRRRAEEIGGRIAVADRPGGGTRVTLDFALSGRTGVRR